MTRTTEGLREKWQEAKERGDFENEKFEEGFLSFLQSEIEAAERAKVEQIAEEVMKLHRFSESKSSEHECSQEGYECGLEDVALMLNTKFLTKHDDEQR